MTRPSLSAILFDLDGTLVNTGPLILTSFALTVEEVLGVALPPETFLGGVGIPLRAQLERLALAHDRGDILGAFGGEEMHRNGRAGTVGEARDSGAITLETASRLEASALEMLAAYQRHNAAIHDDLIEPYEGVDVVLEYLESRGLALGVVTSKRRASALGDLAHFGLDRYFPVLVGADDVEIHKPDPYPLRYGLSLLERHTSRPLPASGAAYVGDSPYDMVASQAAGTHTVGAGWGMFGVDSLREHHPDDLFTAPGQMAALAADLPE